MSDNSHSIAYSDKPAEQMHDIRFVGVINGCYSLANRDGDDDGEGVNICVNVFACRTKSISTKRISLYAPVRGKPGELVRVKLNEFEIITGTICELTSDGFVLDIVADETQCTQIAGTIDWIKKNRFRSQKDKRNHTRITLPEPRSAIVLSDGAIVECFVIDVSQSGVAVSADVCLKKGTPLAVGSAVGVVARNLEVGFAVHFVDALDMDNLDAIFSWPLNYLDECVAEENLVPSNSTD